VSAQVAASRLLRGSRASGEPSPGAAKVCAVNIVYLTRQLHFDGPKLGGRSLVRHLASENNVRVRGGIVDPSSDLLNGQLADVLGTSADLADVDVIYMEGGWNDPALGEDLGPIGKHMRVPTRPSRGSFRVRNGSVLPVGRVATRYPPGDGCGARAAPGLARGGVAGAAGGALPARSRVVAPFRPRSRGRVPRRDTPHPYPLASRCPSPRPHEHPPQPGSMASRDGVRPRPPTPCPERRCRVTVRRELSRGRSQPRTRS
jgi:hypothetical protein